LFSKPQPLLMAAGVLVALAAFPGMPTIPFLLLGTGVGAAAWQMRQKSLKEDKTTKAEPKTAAKENLEALLRVEPLAVEVGLGLVRLVEGGQNSILLRRIAAIRRQLAAESGYVLPPVRVNDNLSLRAREYSILLKGAEVARFELRQGFELAISAGPGARQIEGVATREPAFGIPATWIRQDQTDAARTAGYTVVDAPNVMGTHLAEVIRRHAHELFTRQDAKKLLDRVAEEHPKVVEDLVPKLMPLVTAQKVLQNLLRERVSIRDGVTILEALGEAASVTRNPVLLTEYVRQALGRTIVKPYLNAAGELAAYFFDPAIERTVEGGVEHGEHSSHLTLSPQKIREILDRLGRVAGSVEGPMVSVAGSGSRYFLRQVAEASFTNLTVLSHSEIPAGTKVVSLGVIA